MTTILNQQQIEALIPHARAMSLLTKVVEVSNDHIRCTSISHRSRDNPLRDQDGLAAVNLVEYAAQAAAVHGPCWELQAAAGSADASPSAGGFVVALKGIQLGAINDISTVNDELNIEVRKLLKNADGLIYQFEVNTKGGHSLATGRLTVMFQA